MNSGSSAFIGSHGHSVVTIAAASWYQRSRVGFMSTAPPVRLTTTTQSTPPLLAIAASTLAFSGTFLPPRRPSSAVMTIFDCAVGDALGEAVRREAAEHHRMNGADPRAGQHRVSGFRDHRQIDGDAVALLDIAGAQYVGELADLVMQLAIADVLRLRGIVALPDDRGLVAALVQMAVDAVPGDVEDAVLEPFDRYIAGRKGRVLDLGERLDPADAFGLLGPERRWGLSPSAHTCRGICRRPPRRASPIPRIRRKSSRTSIPPLMRPVYAAAASRLCCCAIMRRGVPARQGESIATFVASHCQSGCLKFLSMIPTATAAY